MAAESSTMLECPDDVAARLDAYAAQLAGEFLFPVTRQQAFERLARTLLPAAPAPAEVTHG